MIPNGAICALGFCQVVLEWTSSQQYASSMIFEALLYTLTTFLRLLSYPFGNICKIWLSLALKAAWSWNKPNNTPVLYYASAKLCYLKANG
jgi:hypothetical protein